MRIWKNFYTTLNTLLPLPLNEKELSNKKGVIRSNTKFSLHFLRDLFTPTFKLDFPWTPPKNMWHQPKVKRLIQLDRSSNKETPLCPFPMRLVFEHFYLLYAPSCNSL